MSDNNNGIQFLDFWLQLSEGYACWNYSPKSKKWPLPFERAHSKTLKRGIVLSTWAAALKKSCPHQMQQSFSAQRLCEVTLLQVPQHFVDGSTAVCALMVGSL
ncbi:hypothetical protein HPB50_028017 [Hyalomma asiaticum]|nr:hypothetical protein HPB50_028017 [Hyalomma asiaticum]